MIQVTQQAAGEVQQAFREAPGGEGPKENSGKREGEREEGCSIVERYSMYGTQPLKNHVKKDL